MKEILEVASIGIYGAMATVALGGLWFVILLVQRTAQKRLSRAAAEPFLNEVCDLLSRRDFDAVTELCDSPAWWSRATPQLILVAIENRDRPLPQIRRLLAERFERDVLADLEYRSSWIATIVKSAPMLGLLGTVVGMINAFEEIAVASQSGISPEALASDISFALVTTALGLTIALPLVLAGNMIQVRVGRLTDSVQEDLGIFFDAFEPAISGAARKPERGT